MDRTAAPRVRPSTRTPAERAGTAPAPSRALDAVAVGPPIPRTPTTPAERAASAPPDASTEAAGRATASTVPTSGPAAEPAGIIDLTAAGPARQVAGATPTTERAPAHRPDPAAPTADRSHAAPDLPGTPLTSPGADRSHAAPALPGTPLTSPGADRSHAAPALPGTPLTSPAADRSHAAPALPGTPVASPETGPTAAGPATSPLVAGPVVLSLDDPAATRTDLVGAKAANLAAARAAGLPTLPGMVLTTVGASVLFSTGEPPAPVAAALRHAWETVSDGGRRAVVVRSSSTLEDAETSSMAGCFTSLLDVRGWDQLLDAVRVVLDSATSPELSDAPMAVLIQPFLEAARGGVLFGADPVTGNADHLVVAAVDGGPDQLVSGTVDGSTTTLTRSGRHVAGAPLDRRTRRRLTRLAHRTETAFGGPQDMEWALDAAGTLWLLQSRPITTPVHHPTGPRFGPGPVAETLPGVLSPLESALWVDPLREGLAEALALSAAVPPGALRRSPVVITVDGQVAVDLDLLEPPRRSGLLGHIDPRPGARRLRAAWRVGRLRAALPALGRDLVEEVDRDLLDVPPLPELDDRQLLGVLDTTRVTLAALHGHEVLTGLLLDVEGSAAVTGASVALQALAEGRAAGLDDGTILERDPVVLALVPPRVGPSPSLPPSPPARPADASDSAGPGPGSGVGDRTGSTAMPADRRGRARAGSSGPAPRIGDRSEAGGSARPGAAPGRPRRGDATSGTAPGSEAAVIREALRVRARWVQELAAGAAWELGRRLHDAGRLPDQELVRWLTLDELDAVVAGHPAPADLATRPSGAAAGTTGPGRPASNGGSASRNGSSPVGADAGAGRDTDPAGHSLTVEDSADGDHVQPLPAAFRLSVEGAVVPDVTDAAGAQGAGGGVNQGPVHVGAEPPPGAVLVVRTLDPGLAPLLPRLGGLVSETGSPLSHLAILAREHGVPTVVGLAGALDAWSPGEIVEVDGTAGTVTAMNAAAATTTATEAVTTTTAAPAATAAGATAGGQA